MLNGVNVALGVSGSIAAVKVVELAHELRRHGASVRAVLSPAATSIVHPWAVDFATDEPVITEITGAVEHVELCGRDGWADVLLLAPATANTVGKIAAAVDDTPVTTCATTALGAGVPVVVAPAMHEPMYDHPGVLDALSRIESWGVSLVDPRIDEGKAKIATESAIVTEVARATTPDPLAGAHVVVTAGATKERLDPIRVLTNRASGKTGRAVARACYHRGADVTLVHDGPDVPYADVVAVETADEMIDACRSSSTSSTRVSSVPITLASLATTNASPTRSWSRSASATIAASSPSVSALNPTSGSEGCRSRTASSSLGVGQSSTDNGSPDRIFSSAGSVAKSAIAAAETSASAPIAADRQAAIIPSAVSPATTSRYGTSGPSWTSVTSAPRG